MAVPFISAQQSKMIWLITHTEAFLYATSIFIKTQLSLKSQESESRKSKDLCPRPLVLKTDRCTWLMQSSDKLLTCGFYTGGYKDRVCTGAGINHTNTDGKDSP